MIYLDNAATTKPSQSVVSVAQRVISNDFGNPSSLHRLGVEAENILTNARREIAQGVRCSVNEIYFTSGATESNNIAIMGAVAANSRNGNKIITTTIEHPSVLMVMKKLESMGYAVIYVSPRIDGVIYSKDISDLVDEDTILVSVMHVNNETGLRLPIEQTAKEVKQKNIKTIVHVDGVQGFTKLPLQLTNNCNIDLYSFSGHKIHALKGVGGLYIKNKTKITPLFFGGGQENGIRVGTQNTVGIATLGAAVSEGYHNLLDNLQHYRSLREYLIMKLREIDCVMINSNDFCVDYIVNFSVVGVKSEIMLHFLEEQEIYVSSGSACSSRDKNKKSSVLMALNLSAGVVDSAIRVSFAKDNSKEDIDVLVKQIKASTLRFIKNRR